MNYQNVMFFYMRGALYHHYWSISMGEYIIRNTVEVEGRCSVTRWTWNDELKVHRWHHIISRSVENIENIENLSQDSGSSQPDIWCGNKIDRPNNYRPFFAHFTYLGSEIDNNEKYEREVNRRAQMWKNVMFELNKIWRDGTITKHTKIR